MAHSKTPGGVRLAGLRSVTADVLPVLVFDGGCPFCRHFAELSELRGGIPDLQIRDGRSDHALRLELARRGYRLGSGAMLLLNGEVLHGAEAIQWICARMRPSARLLRLLAPLLATPSRSRALYPLLLLARRLTLGFKGLQVEPETPQA
ncbi:MAG: DCC1-like thiol-disulfide oxidoreductase family protein [Prochlorococcaceae cyanobacterium]